MINETTAAMSDPATLPPGFRFHPTDEELILHYLRNQAAGVPCPVSIIAEVDIYKFDPWELPARARFGEQEWYFFSPRDRKYPNGVRPNRAAASGYWKATGTDKPIYTGRAAGKNEHVGVKKALVFYRGKPPKGRKTNWIMHEYRLADTRPSNTYRPVKFADTSMRLDDWVLCRIYKKHSHLDQAVPPPLVDQEQEEHLGGGRGCASSFHGQGSGDRSQALQRSFSVSDFLEGFAAAPCHLFDGLPEPATQAPGGELGVGGLLMAAPPPPPPSMNQLIADNVIDAAAGGEIYGGAGASKRPRIAESSSSSSYLDADLSNQCNMMNQRFLMSQQILLNSHLGLR